MSEKPAAKIFTQECSKKVSCKALEENCTTTGKEVSCKAYRKECTAAGKTEPKTAMNEHIFPCLFFARGDLVLVALYIHHDNLLSFEPVLYISNQISPYRINNTVPLNKPTPQRTHNQQWAKSSPHRNHLQSATSVSDTTKPPHAPSNNNTTVEATANAG